MVRRKYAKSGLNSTSYCIYLVDLRRHIKEKRQFGNEQTCVLVCMLPLQFDISANALISVLTLSIFIWGGEGGMEHVP